MKLSFKSPHKSITSLEEIELPDLTVITGLNGTGKTHLLDAIKNNSILADNIDISKIIYFNASSLSLKNELPTSKLKIDMENQEIINQFKSKKSQALAIINKFKSYENVKDICIAKNKNFINLTDEDFTTAEEFQNYSSIMPSYKMLLSQFKIKPDQYVTHDYGIAFNNFASNLPHSIHELEESEFRKLFIPYSIDNFLLPQSIGKTFWHYYLKREENEYSKYYNSKYPDQKQKTTYTDQEFEEKYGKKPWDTINNILKQFESIDYHVNSPEGLYSDDQYHYKLVNNFDENITVNHTDLSSGERILMALVGLIYRLKLDNNIPELILLDEVDASLHPSMIKMLLTIVNDTLISINKKVIIVTHSPTTIALSPEDSIFVMSKYGSKRLEKKSKTTALSILTEGYATFEDGLTFLDHIFKTPICLITEGYNSNLIRQALKLMQCDNIEVLSDLEGISGKNQLKTLFVFLTNIPHDNKIIFVWDCDANYKLTDTNNTFAYILEQQGENTIAKKGIENMFPSHLFDGFTNQIIRSNGASTKAFDNDRKRDFENFILERNNPEDFKNFSNLVEQIEHIKNEAKLSN